MIEYSLKRMFGLQERVVVLTGAAGGIGSAIACGMASVGAVMALCDINTAQLAEVEKKITAAGGRASSHVMDVTQKGSIHACIQEIHTKYGRIDVLINCAGINVREGIMDVPEERYDKIMAINLKGVFMVSREVAPIMKAQNAGSIINIGSHNTGSILGGCSVYGATKCGVLSFTRSMAVEWAKYLFAQTVSAPDISVPS